MIKFEYLKIVFHQYSESHLRGRDHTHTILTILLSVD